ncbi:GyrI-like domain-containing protein [Xanthobacter sp. TB0139]|uniref:GyrI-like domain-containing protein n=1 Tax=Xanthobacter sp. TB0139 TaxID=3459178 RepID=UPI00403A03A8
MKRVNGRMNGLRDAGAAFQLSVHPADHAASRTTVLNRTIAFARARSMWRMGVLACLLAFMPAGALAAIDAMPEQDELTAPPVIDPKNVETQPLSPLQQPAPFRPGETQMEAQPALLLSGKAGWDNAYEGLVEAFRTLEQERARLGLKRAGEQIVVYESSDDEGFTFKAQLPYSGVTAQTPGKNVKLGSTHAGKMLTFEHSGSFADMDNTYEMIANFLDERAIDAQDLYMERYRTDLLTTPPDILKIEILVPAPEGGKGLLRRPNGQPLPPDLAPSIPQNP